MRAILILTAGLFLAGAASAAEDGKSEVRCRTCHTTDTPTKEKPALVKCPRAMVKGYHSLEQAVGRLEFPGKGEYGPVEFSHKAHAAMAEMGEGCGSCHHYNQARSIQACSECHSKERLRADADLGRPDLVGARHRQCVDCHRRWSGSSECASCHAKEGAKAKAAPKTKAPEKIVFDTPTQRSVPFAHKDHVENYGLKCADCHQKQSCAACHGPEDRLAATRTRATPAGMTRKDAHRSCFSCHAQDGCAKCHSGKRR